MNHKKPSYDKHFPEKLGSYQKNKFDMAIEHVDDWSCAVDIGGHVGHWAYNMAEKFAYVHSFEPVPSNFECLKENLGNNPKVIFHNVGLSDAEGELKLYLEFHENSGTWTSEKNKKEDMEEVIVPIKTLDSFNLAPSFIKMDVQNHEYFVLKGAEETLKKYQPVLCLESRFNSKRKEIISFLTSLGYERVGGYSKEEFFKVVKKSIPL